MTLPKRTKIVATLGPASSSLDVLSQMFKAGCDVVRINFSHGSHKELLSLIQTTRLAAKQCQREIGILADLQGPKIRIACFENGAIDLKNGQDFRLDCNKKELGDNRVVGVDYSELAHDIKAGDILLLDDGLIELKVNTVKQEIIDCTVTCGGRLSNHKGINLKGGGLSAGALTDKDKADLKFAIKANVDYIALSFARNADDIHLTRRHIREAGGNTAIIAKIERADAINHIDDIIKASDSVMVARGDLGVEIGLAEVPFVQKHIIQRARALDKTVITATQMMESMIKHPQATRAEVSDVANAVLDGTDAVMLSAETAVGDYPVKVIETVHEVCTSAERHPATQRSGHRLECEFDRVDESIAMAAMYIANHYPVRAIITLTETGASPLLMSRIRSNIPILALSRHLESQRKMTLYRGVYPKAFDPTEWPLAELENKAIDYLKQQQLVDVGDVVIFTKGSALGLKGMTDSLKVLHVS